MANTVNESAIKKLKLLFTVVDRNKGEFYLDVLSQYEVNFQTVVNGMGTARSEILDMLGLNNSKAVVISVIREDDRYYHEGAGGQIPHHPQWQGRCLCCAAQQRHRCEYVPVPEQQPELRGNSHDDQ